MIKHVWVYTHHNAWISNMNRSYRSLPLSSCCIIVGQSDTSSYLCPHHWPYVTVQSVAVSSSSFSFVSLSCFSLFLCLPVRESKVLFIKRLTLFSPGVYPAQSKHKTIWSHVFGAWVSKVHINTRARQKCNIDSNNDLSLEQNCLCK